MRGSIVVASVLVTALAITATPAAADGYFSVRLGGDGWGISFGAADWAPYGRSWSDPSWHLSFATLDGYGEWVWVDGIGRVWRPWVAAEWRPYQHGRWVWTELGWTWVSYEPWGYVPHHFGSWALTGFGWVWQPGYQYQPANVVWARSGGYVGWYPSAPPGWSHAARGFRHGYRHGYDRGYGRGYGDGYEDGWRDARYATWVEWSHVGAEDLSRHAVPGWRMEHRIGAGTEVSTRAPARSDVVRRGGAVPAVRVEKRRVEMGGQRVEIARPSGVRDSIERQAPRVLDSALDERSAPRAMKSVDRSTGPGHGSELSSDGRAIAHSPSARSSERRLSSRDTAERSDRRTPGSDRAPVVIPSRSSDRSPSPYRAPSARPDVRSIPSGKAAPSRAPAARSDDGRWQVRAPEVSGGASSRADGRAPSAARPSAGDDRQPVQSRSPRAISPVIRPSDRARTGRVQAPTARAPDAVRRPSVSRKGADDRRSGAPASSTSATTRRPAPSPKASTVERDRSSSDERSQRDRPQVRKRGSSGSAKRR